MSQVEQKNVARVLLQRSQSGKSNAKYHQYKSAKMLNYEESGREKHWTLSKHGVNSIPKLQLMGNSSSNSEIGIAFLNGI